jgi:hypothetical protein
MSQDDPGYGRQPDPAQPGQPSQPGQFNQYQDQPEQPGQYGAPYPGQAGPPGQYGQNPGQPGGPAPAVARPKRLDTATILWLAGAVVWLIAGFVSGGNGELHFYSSRSETVNGQTITRTSSSPAPIGVLIVVLVIVVLVWALFVFFLWRGQQWARVLLTVLGVLGCLGTLANLFSAGAVVIVLDVVVLAAVITAMVLMWGREVTRYVRSPH